MFRYMRKDMYICVYAPMCLSCVCNVLPVRKNRKKLQSVVQKLKKMLPLLFFTAGAVVVAVAFVVIVVVALVTIWWHFCYVLEINGFLDAMLILFNPKETLNQQTYDQKHCTFPFFTIVTVLFQGIVYLGQLKPRLTSCNLRKIMLLFLAYLFITRRQPYGNC